MASRAAAVLAGVVGVDLGAAVIAAPQVPAERVRSAGEDVGDGTPVRGQHRRTMGRQIVLREAAEDIRECDHDWSTGSQVDHELVEGRLERSACGFGQMQIDGRRGDVDVPEQNLHHACLDTVLQQPRSVAMAKTVWTDRTLDAGSADGETEGAPQ